MHRFRIHARAVALLFISALPLLALGLAATPAAARPQAAALHAPESSAKAEALLARIAVLGASVSNGYGLAPDAQGNPVDLARVIDGSLAIGHEPILDASSALTFTDALGTSQRAFRQLAEKKPTLVVALDYLFWFGYGTSWGGEKERLAALERGLEPLSKLECPILLGDFPDMSSALQSKVRLLPPQAVPPPEVLAKLNARLGEWAKQHPNVIVVPVSKLMLALRAGDELRVAGNLWAKGRVQALLQDDGLHTTLEGTTGLWLFALERLCEARRELTRKAFETDAGVIVHKLAPDAKLAAIPDPTATKGKAAPAAKGERAGKEH